MVKNVEDWHYKRCKDAGFKWFLRTFSVQMENNNFSLTQLYEEALNYKLEWQPLCIYQLPFDFFSSLTKVLLLWKSKLQEIAIWCQIGGKNNKKLVCLMIGGGLQEQGLGSLIIFQLTLNKTMTFKQPIKKYCNAFLLL